MLSYYVENFANPGRSALFANMPNDIAVSRDANGLITSINTGANTLEVAPAGAALLALDPNAFNVIHKDSLGMPFRTTTISGSSAEFVGELWFGKISKCMI